MKAYLDTKRKAKIPVFKEGDLLRVRKSVHVLKGRSKFSDPMQITKKKGPQSYELMMDILGMFLVLHPNIESSLLQNSQILLHHCTALSTVR